GAIDLEDQFSTRHDECILCRTCQTVCPKGAVSFLPSPEIAALGEAASPVPVDARRQFMVGGLAGLGTAVFSLFPSKPDAADLRPPGSVPEKDFLARCVRCAACVAVCPHNALQPLYDGTGVSGLFSPGLVPAGGYCEPSCSRCAEVCPTDAIVELTGDERLWAKTGTAAVVREDCLAWENKEKCMVCDEVCPVDAVVFKIEPDIPVTVPHVEENKCIGCGYCENACPVKRPAAIRVSPKNALRLKTGSYVHEGRKRGLNIALDTSPRTPGADSADEAPAPGFDAPAPGFSN
ncbi:MAG: 4Fe-4S dicluster domain-containing protein, partial [Rhodospirillales bacterium]|nr:4Fe-4S dicluster domain-containing protein [Rhodospirillales bacterium]